ncbi:SMI1/KNR4 family protein [Archangium sp.]|uniref:SMI1/KNR4 family protein n=1 Tax=Archangium sp. TaxID=1872627 RepID=UPI002EDAB844
MHEWLEGLQKSAKRMVAGVGTEDIRRAETECGVPFPEELGALYRTSDGGDFLGDVSLFPLHGPEGAPSVLEKTRLKLESLPAAGVWRIGVKGPHRQLFAARKSAMVEQADSPLPGWAESLSDDDWIYGTWETEARELRLYRSLQSMLEVLVPPAEVEEFGDRTFARALSAVQGALTDLSVEYEEGETPKAAAEEAEDEAEEDEGEEEEEADEGEEEEAGEEEEESEEDEGEEEEPEEKEEDTEASRATAKQLRQPVIAAAARRVEQLRKPATQEQAEPVRPQGVAQKTADGARSAVKKAASVVESAAKTAASVANTTAAVANTAAAVARTVAGTSDRGGATATKTPTRGAATPAKTPAPAPMKKTAAPAQKAAAKKTAAPAQKAAAKKAPAKKAAGAKKAPARGRR